MSQLASMLRCGVTDALDGCPGSDDDLDGDGVPCGCDQCLGSDDTI